MGCSGEEVHGHGFFGLIAQGGESAQVPGQGGGVAGDVHNAFGRHGRHRFSYRRHGRVSLSGLFLEPQHLERAIIFLPAIILI